MNRRDRLRLGAGGVAAVSALMIALSGVAVALPGTNVVDSGDIKNGTIKNKDLSAATKAGLVGPAGPAGAAGAAGPAGPAGSFKSVTSRTQTTTVEWDSCQDFGAPPSVSKFCTAEETVVVPCNAGEHATAGGHTRPTAPPPPAPPPASTVFVNADRPNPASGDPTGWAFTVTASGSSFSATAPAPEPAEPTVDLHVVCAA